MKNRFRIFTLVAGIGLMIQLSAPLPLNGQTPRSAAPVGSPGPGAAANASPLLATGPDLVSPEVASDRRVTFRFAAPNATQVTVIGITGFAGPPITMQKDERGVWTGTSEPLAPEIYQYNFMVDGARVGGSARSCLCLCRREDRSEHKKENHNRLAPIRPAETGESENRHGSVGAFGPPQQVAKTEAKTKVSSAFESSSKLRNERPRSSSSTNIYDDSLAKPTDLVPKQTNSAIRTQLKEQLLPTYAH